MNYLLTLIYLSLFSISALARTNQIQRFDHKMHEDKVFAKTKTKCSECHNLKESKLAGSENDLVATESLSMLTFKKSLKSICHDCHQGGKVKDAPKTCYTCHSNQEQMLMIKPANHLGSSWTSQHASQARADSAQCADCHSNSQCIKCHASRNPINNVNHSRNYRYYHSIEARLRPQACDSCHVKSYCTRCHVGGTK